MFKKFFSQIYNQIIILPFIGEKWMRGGKGDQLLLGRFPKCEYQGKSQIPMKVHCQGTFNFKGSNMFFFCVLFLKDSIPCQFLENRNEKSCTRSWLRSWERAPAWIPFSDSLQWPFQLCPSYSRYWMLSGPLKIVICLALFLLNFFYCLKLPCMKIYKHAFLQIKHPCFTRDLGSLHPSSRWLQSPGPGLQRPWQHGVV